MQGVQVPSQVGELYVLTCRGAAKFERCQLESLHTAATETVCSRAGTPQLEKPPCAATRENLCAVTKSLGVAMKTQGSPPKKVVLSLNGA